MKAGARLKDEVVLITGSSSGIGRETAFRFAAEGARVILTYFRGKGRGEAAERRTLKLGAADTLLLRLDVMDGGSIAAALKKVIRKYRGIDVLVNNAGVGVFLHLKDHTTKDVERQVRTNFEGLIRMTRAFLPYVRKAVINIASAAGKEAYPEMAVYCGTKFGVRGFTQALAGEYPHLKICCVNPDMTATRLSGYEGRPPSEVAEVIFRAASGQIRFKRGGDVDVWEVMP